MPDTLLQPILHLNDLFGSCVYCPRPSPSACRWLPSGEPFLNALTGGQLTLAGDTPVLCSRGVSTPAAFQLLSDSGFSPPLHLYRFETGKEHLDQMRALAKSGRPIVVNHFHPMDELDPACCWISPELLNYLNNKANLEELGPMENIPRRRLGTLEEFKENASAVQIPAVLKAAVNESSGGGADVVICRNSYQLKQALKKFIGADRIVVESFLDIVGNFCLNYALMHDGQVKYLGCAEQVIDSFGNYRGNWIEADYLLPPSVLKLGAEISAHGAALGYYGFLGIDVAVLPNEHVVVYDLNYRANGSTASLIFSESIFSRTGASVMRLRSWMGKAGYQQLLQAAYRALHRGFILPLWSYDPSADGYMDSAPRIGGLILGEKRKDIQDIELELTTLGLT